MDISQRPLLSLCLVVALAGAAHADFEQGHFPLADGNAWTYQADDGGEGLTVRIDRATDYQGSRYFRLRGYQGDSQWVRQPTAGEVLSGSRLWYRLGAGLGERWTFRVAGDAEPGSHEARLQITTLSERVRTPAGAFDCLRVRWERAAGDGITDEWFAPGIGLVQRRVRRAGVTRDLELVHAVVSGQTVVGAAPSPSPTVQGAFGIVGQVPASAVRVRTILDNTLRNPTALAFHPSEGSLWIMDRELDGTVVLLDAGLPSMRGWIYRDDSDHFNNNPMALAFSRQRNEFATALESRNDYNGKAAPNNFMGPTLWSGDRDAFDGGAATHLDMLHHSPLAVGIAAGVTPPGEVDQREYWVFNGDAGGIDRYLFREPHVPGGHDHSDGITIRYGNGLARVPGVPGHLALDPTAGVLYVADTGNGRIVKLDTRAHDVNTAFPITPYHNEVPLLRVPGVQFQAVTAPGALARPAGLILSQDRLVVSDHDSGHVLVFSRDGALEGDLDTGLGPNAITGIAESPGGTLWVLDGHRGRVLEVSVP
jgi:DNA-binding beta-propeller fold protein YncE